MRRVQPPLGEVQAVWCWEIQGWRGVPHLHGLLAGVSPEVRRMSMVDWSYREFGIARVLEYDPSLGARFYLSKYLTKQMADIEFFGLHKS